MDTIAIRSVKPEDYEDIFILSAELGYSYPKEKTMQRIRYILYHTKDIVLVAEKKSRVIGYIHATPYELMYHDPIMNILGFIVKEEFRSEGIGHKLITEAEVLAKKHGFTGFRLTSGDYRAGAHRFYEKHGFTTNKTSKKFVKKFYDTDDSND